MTSAIGPRAFFFIRHGETDWNREGRLQGRHDVGLNARGLRQAEQSGLILARLFERQGLQAGTLDWIASPLSRARRTMALVRGGVGLSPEPYSCDDRLLEIAFGTWEGHTWAEVKRIDPAGVEERRRDRWNVVPPGGESYAMLMDRVAPWLATLDEHAVVVAHGGVARVLLHLAAGLTRSRAPYAEILQGRVLVFHDGAADWV